LLYSGHDLVIKILPRNASYVSTRFTSKEGCILLMTLLTLLMTCAFEKIATLNAYR